MVRLTRIYTRGGDSGETSLGDGARVPKHALRVAAYGTVDEANAAIGIARLHVDAAAGEMLDRILAKGPITVLKKPLNSEQLQQTVRILGHKEAVKLAA